ncbi:MAG: hypothetical protein ACP5GY_01465 [Vulcanisaeta sp.]
MRKIQKNCLTLVIDVCNDSFDRFKSVLNTVIRKAGFGGALRVLVYKCKDLDFNRYVRELNSVVANNFTVTIFVYEFDNLESLIKELNNNIFSNCDNVSLLSTIELPININYERLK